MDLDFKEYRLRNLGAINVILGKNGSGKSTLLRAFDEARTASKDGTYVRYVTPERGGFLTYDGNLETQMVRQDGWLGKVRRANQRGDFRQMSVSEFRKLEVLALREIEKNPAVRSNATITFESTVAEINALLDHVEISRADSGFEVHEKGATAGYSVESLSSGQAELISLAIEILTFSYSIKQAKYVGKDNWLLFDSPDVHLHPDLQHR
jgi:ABC-type cobalamin/Fe3+-siderophores transport system ATPase subunit